MEDLAISTKTTTTTTLSSFNVGEHVPPNPPPNAKKARQDDTLVDNEG